MTDADSLHWEGVRHLRGRGLEPGVGDGDDAPGRRLQDTLERHLRCCQRLPERVHALVNVNPLDD